MISSRKIKPIALWVSFAVIGAMIFTAAMVVRGQLEFADAKAGNNEGTSLEMPAQLQVEDTNPFYSVDSASDLTIEATNFRIEEGFLRADLCYELPSGGDWLLGVPLLETGDQTTVVYEFNLIDWKSSSDGTLTHRCDWVSFPIDEKSDFSNFQIIIPRLETSRPDNLDCESAQKKLDLAGSGIVVECHEEEWVTGFSIIQTPSNMLALEANSIAADAFIDIVVGPWVLEGKLP